MCERESIYISICIEMKGRMDNLIEQVCACAFVCVCVGVSEGGRVCV